MEEWQERYVQKKMFQLVQQTSFNVEVETFLRAADVISEVDIDELRTKGKSEGKFAETKMMYNKLLTRCNSYRAIGEAAFQSKQSGTFSILLLGLVQHLLQQNHNLKEMAIDDVINAECLNQASLEFFRRKLNGETLYKWKPPGNDDLYISRHISNRVKLNPDVFKENCRDVFVFKEIKRSELSKLVKPPNLTVLSRNVIVQKKATARFILLERQDHWEHIRPLYSQPIHLIEFDRNEISYILQQTNGISDVVSKHIDPQSKDKTLYVSENEFREQLITNITNPPQPTANNQPTIDNSQRSVCICDIPGMGKTWLLENIASSIQQLCSNHFVAVIRLPDFIPAQQKMLLDGQNALQVLLTHLCPCSITVAIWTEILKTEATGLELFLDGFDEILAENQNWVKVFVNALLKNHKNVRLFVTSRPHLRRDLETALGAMAYDILPLSTENQVDCIVKIWLKSLQQKIEIVDEEEFKENLKEFANICLQRLKGSLRKQDSDLMGIPLQCFLLASVNETNAEMYCTLDKTSSANEYISPTSMYEMYSKYVGMGLDKARERSKQNTDNDSNTNDSETRNSLRTFHVWKALDLLYLELSQDYFQREGLSKTQPSAEHLACGILQGIDNSVTFLHRSFAEYLVAEYFAEVVTGQYIFSEFENLTNCLRVFTQDFLSTVVLHDDFQTFSGSKYKVTVYGFKNTVMALCLNGSLENITLDSIPEAIGIQILNLLSQTKASEILSACIVSGLTGIMRLVQFCYCKVTTDSEVVSRKSSFIYPSDEFHQDCIQNDHYISRCVYLCLAAKYSNVEVMQELYNFFEDYLQENLDDICFTMPADYESPLHYAVERHEYNLVEFFADRISLPQRRLLYHCVQNTKDCSQDEVNNIIEICRMLLEKCSSLINEVNGATAQNPVLANNIHVELIKFLIDEGANLLAINGDGGNIVTTHMHSLEQDAFADLCQFLIENVKAYDLFKPNPRFREDPLMSVVTTMNEEILERIMRIPGIQFNCVDEDGKNLIHWAIEEGGTLDVVKNLITIGVDARQKTKSGQGALHTAATSGAVDIATYLMSVLPDVSLDDQDEYGSTALLCAYEHLEMVKLLVSENANTLVVDNEGNSIAHIAAGSWWDQDVFEYLHQLESAGDLFQLKNAKGETALQILLSDSRNDIKSETVERILQLPKVRESTTDEEYASYFLAAVESRKSCRIVEVLRKSGVNLSIKNKGGENALHISSRNGDLELVKYLLSHGLLDNVDNSGESVLHKAVHHFEILNFLKTSKAKYFTFLAVDNHGNNIAHTAARSSIEKQVLNLLVSLPEAPELFAALNNERKTPLDILIANGYCPNLSDIEPVLNLVKISQNTILNASNLNYKGQSALHKVIERGYLEVTNYFISLHVFDLEMRDNNGNTPLLSSREWIEIVKCLLSHGANILAADKNNNTIAHKVDDVDGFASFALQQDDFHCIFNAVNDEGRTPIHHWIAAGAHLAVGKISMILEISNIDINAEDIQGRTMFLSAVGRNCSIQLLEVLLNLGSNRNQIDIEGHNALHLAVKNGCQETVQYLISIGVSLTDRDRDQNTPLMIASGNLEMLKFLIAQNANIFDVDGNGDNIAHKAATFDDCYCRELVMYLTKLEEGNAIFKISNNRGEIPLLHWIKKSNWKYPFESKIIEQVLNIPEFDVDVTDNNGENLFICAIKLPNFHTILELLLKCGTNRNVVNNDGVNALHLAVNSIEEERLDIQLVEYLVSIGCNVNHKNKDGKTPLELAESLSQDDSYSHIAKIVIDILRRTKR